MNANKKIIAQRTGFSMERDLFQEIMKKFPQDSKSAVLAINTFYQAMSVRLADVYGIENVIESVKEAYQVATNPINCRPKVAKEKKEKILN